MLLSELTEQNDLAVILPPSDQHELHTIEQLLALLRASDDGWSRLARVAKSGELKAYLLTRGTLDKKLLQELGALFERLDDKPRLTLFALRYALAPHDPLSLTNDIEIHSPSQIAPLVAASATQRDAVIAALRDLVADGRLDEWLRVLGPEGWERTVEVMDKVRSAYPHEKDLAVYALLWREVPSIGFPVSDGWVNDPKELAAWIDADPDYRKRGLELLEHGWIAAWLTATGRLDDRRHLHELVSSGPSQAAQTEILLHVLDADISDPVVVAEPTSLILSVDESSNEGRTTVTLTNRSRGHAWGEVSLEGDSGGLQLGSKSFDGTPATLSIKFDTRRIPDVATRQANLLVRVKNSRQDQVLRVPISFQIRVPIQEMVLRSVGVGLLAGIVMWLLRMLTGIIIQDQAWAQRLDWISFDQVSAAFDRSFGELVGLLILGLALVGAVAGGLLYLVKVCRE